MKGLTIGKTMPHGYAGSYSRQPDMIVETHPLGGTEKLEFGSAVLYGTNGAVIPFGESGTAADFIGIAIKEVKSATDYFNQDAGSYQPGEAVPVMKRGCVNVICQNGTPTADGTVYVRTKKSESHPNAVIGGFEASADSANSVTLTNAKWKGSADANGVAELCILTRSHA